MQKIRDILGAQAAPTDDLLEWKCTACEEVFKVICTSWESSTCISQANTNMFVTYQQTKPCEY